MAINLRNILDQLMGAGGDARSGTQDGPHGTSGAGPQSASGAGPQGAPGAGPQGAPGAGPMGGAFGGSGLGGLFGSSGGLFGSGGLGQMFGNRPGASGGAGGGSLRDILGRATGGQAAAAGGLLGAVLGGGLFRTGGMALVGLLAHRAYAQWQAQQAGATAMPADDQFAQPEAADSQGKPFGLSIIRAMVAAARADGALDNEERERIFAEAERLDLSAEEKAEVFGVLDTPPDPRAIAALAATEAQKAELYLASAMAMGEVHSASERTYLGALAGALRLPPELRARLDAQLREAAEAARQQG
jgi:uncharacterized membrane protein YebE (DUF533 family)